MDPTFLSTISIIPGKSCHGTFENPNGFVHIRANKPSLCLEIYSFEFDDLNSKIQQIALWHEFPLMEKPQKILQGFDFLVIEGKDIQACEKCDHIQEARCLSHPEEPNRIYFMIKEKKLNQKRKWGVFPSIINVIENIHKTQNQWISRQSLDFFIQQVRLLGPKYTFFRKMHWEGKILSQNPLQTSFSHLLEKIMTPNMQFDHLPFHKLHHLALKIFHLESKKESNSDTSHTYTNQDKFIEQFKMPLLDHIKSVVRRRIYWGFLDGSSYSWYPASIAGMLKLPPYIIQKISYHCLEMPEKIGNKKPIS